MMHEDDSPRRPELPKYVRVVGAVWLTLMLAILVSVVLAPYVGRMVDGVLHQTSHRQWTAIRLQPQEVYFDRSLPIHTVQSYYSAMYRASANDMDRLTIGPLREQMRQRMAHREVATDTSVYRSFAQVIEQEATWAVVEEKFHLFWNRGLRFVMTSATDGWRVAQVTPLP